MTSNIALASCNELTALSNLNHLLSPVAFASSNNKNYFKRFAETSLCLEKKFFFDNIIIDYVFFAVNDNLDQDKFINFFQNKRKLLNDSIIFTGSFDSVCLENLNQNNMLSIINGNFFCSFKTFCMFHGFYKFNKTIIANKFHTTLKEKYSNELQIDIFTFIFLLKRLNVKIVSLNYDR